MNLGIVNFTDRDECSYHSGRICQQACMNTVGSFLCSCEDGYSLAADDFSCVGMLQDRALEWRDVVLFIPCWDAHSLIKLNPYVRLTPSIKRTVLGTNIVSNKEAHSRLTREISQGKYKASSYVTNHNWERKELKTLNILNRIVIRKITVVDEGGSPWHVIGNPEWAQMLTPTLWI